MELLNEKELLKKVFLFNKKYINLNIDNPKNDIKSFCEKTKKFNYDNLVKKAENDIFSYEFDLLSYQENDTKILTGKNNIENFKKCF